MEPDPELNRWTNLVIGAAIEVHREVGAGFPESTYQRALEHELSLRGVPFTRQVPFAVKFKGVVVGEGRMDFLIADRVIVEIKSVEAISPVHVAQAIAYLRATKHRLCLLINF
ncbi:MAG: GxxExxY protein, partial [Tepidisphaeraceae bacterium]